MVRDFIDAYIETMLWAETDMDTDEPLEANFGVDDISPEAMEHITKDCTDFYESFNSLWDDDEGAGHDFWLTRNGHGAGFWDGDYEEEGELEGVAIPDVGDFLTEKCKELRGVDVYIGDDGKIYFL